MRSTLAIASAIAWLAAGSCVMAGPGEDLLQSNQCSKCHMATTTKKTPSFAAIAQKYKDDSAKPAKLAELLKHGSDDHKPIKASDADLKAMVSAVLSSK
jgi:cytochrome c551/c552